MDFYTCGSQGQRLTECLVLLSCAAENRAENTPVLESCANAMFAVIQACCARASAVAAFNPVNLQSRNQRRATGREILFLSRPFPAALEEQSEHCRENGYSAGWQGHKRQGVLGRSSRRKPAGRDLLFYTHSHHFRRIRHLPMQTTALARTTGVQKTKGGITGGTPRSPERLPFNVMTLPSKHRC